jgi:hypothetical protein
VPDAFPHTRVSSATNTLEFVAKVVLPPAGDTCYSVFD